MGGLEVIPGDATLLSSSSSSLHCVCLCKQTPFSWRYCLNFTTYMYSCTVL